MMIGEIAAQGELPAVIAIAPRAIKLKYAAGEEGIAGSAVIREVMLPEPLQKFHSADHAAGQLLLQTRAPVESVRGVLRLQVGGKGSSGGRAYGRAIEIEESVDAGAGPGPGDDFEQSRIVEPAGAERELGRRGKHDGGSQARGPQRAAENLIPIEAQTGFEQYALADAPAVQKIGAGCDVVLAEGNM